MNGEAGPLLLRNCAALAARDPRLSALIMDCPPDAAIDSVVARSGAVVPVVRGAGGASPLHSRYDPAREAERLAPAWEGAGCVVVIGLGGGFHVSSMLQNGRVGAVLVVEKNAAVLRALFERVPLVNIISDRRVWFCAGARALADRIRGTWHPLLMGGLRVFALRTWCARQAVFCQEAERAVSSAVAAARSDYSVQAHFGKRWFANMLENMERAETSPEPRGLERARVAAAGPSLDGQLGRLAAAREEGPLLAVDTTLPALMRAGIPPDAVVSIDCQVHGYHHFLQGMPKEAVLYLDLASPPLLARGRPSARFVAGNHPFATYLSRRWRRFPAADTSGGNVTHAAVSLALGMGARPVTLYGADFSYPAGKLYARGTYLYDVFSLGAGRLHPMHGRFYGFLFRTDDTTSERVGELLRYTTPLMAAYRDRLQDLMNTSGTRIVAVTGEGLPLVVPERPREVAPTPARGPASAVCGWRELLDQYAATLAGLPAFDDPPWVSFDSFDAEGREAGATLLPIAACMARETPAGMSGAQALEAARAWAVARVRRLVDSGRGTSHA